VTQFTKGDRVKATELAFADGLFPKFPKGTARPVTGTVVGRGQYPASVRVIRDGQKTVRTYHVDFWETTPSAPEEE
jgi:hypothetical protein